MYEVNLLNNKTKQEFTKVFWNEKELKKFINKLKYSKNLTILQILNNSYLYD